MSRARILVVDDEQGMLRSVERVLAPQHDVRGARTAGQALETAAAFAPDLAILDIRMPEMDGFELMAKLKEQRPDLDVILMTGSVNEPDTRLIRAIREKAFYFIHKPFERDVLLTLVARCLEVRRLNEENRHHVARLEDELEAGRSFQKSLLPPDAARCAGVAIAARCMPCVELCGDLFDYAPAGPDGAAILIADVSGHGVAASMIAAVIKLAFRSASEHGYEPTSVLERIAQDLPHVGTDRFVTAVVARIAGDPPTLEYASAGHPPALVLHGDGAVARLESTGPVIHPLLPRLGWETRKVPWRRDDALLLYTDGVTEAEDGEGPFGRKRLEAEAVRCESAGKDVVAGVLDALLLFLAGRPLEDDVTLVHARAADRR